MLNEKVTVPLPKSGIIVRKTGKYQYVYKVLATFRNALGQPTNTRKQIGRLSSDGEWLIPNNAYYEFYETTATHSYETTANYVDDGEALQEKHTKVISVGATFLVSHMLSRLGILGMLDRAVGSLRCLWISIIATYMLCEGNVLAHITDWSEEHILENVILSSQKASVLFSKITHDERMSFFKSWTALQAQSGSIAYDVTSFSSYSKGLIDLEWGYNRDGDKLPQINLGCYISQESRLPLFYVTYPGSIVDKSHLPYMMAYNEELGIGENITYVMDRGFCSTANIDYMHQAGLSYVCGVDLQAKNTRQAIDEVRSDIVSLRNLATKGTYALCVRSRFYGESSVLHIFNNPELGERQRSELLRTVENMESQLKQLKNLSDKELKRFSRFFDINAGKGSVSFERNYDRIDDAAKYCGFFCILTNTEYPSSDILEIYKRKDVIEKGFDDIKNYTEMKRLRVHSDSTAAGKLFCAFIALIAASEMSNSLRIYNDLDNQKYLSKRALMNELEKIRVLDSSKGRRLINPLTKTQRNIFKAFGISEGALASFILNGQT